jgi:predicted HTH domain antitoxin
MTQVTVQFPETVLSMLRRSPDELAREIRVAAAVDWYRRGLVSQAVAADLAGLVRSDFIEALAHRGVDVMQEDDASLARSVAVLCK